MTIRVELNKIDAAGLDDADAVRAEQLIAAKSPQSFTGARRQQTSAFPSGPAQFQFPAFPAFPAAPGWAEPQELPAAAAGSNAIGQPQYTNPYAVIYDSLFEKPQKNSPKSSGGDTYKYVDVDILPPVKAPTYKPIEKPTYGPEIGYEDPSFGYEPPSYGPPSYEPPPYEPPAYEAPDYAPPPPAYEEPAPYVPVGPVLLDKRPYEVKSIQPLPITVSESYSSFDCRARPPGRHYADPETKCQVRQPTLCCV